LNVRRWMSLLLILYFIVPSYYHIYNNWSLSWYAFGWNSYHSTWSLSSPILFLVFSILNFGDFAYYASWFMIPLLLLVVMFFELKTPSRGRAFCCFLLSALLTVMSLFLIQDYGVSSLYGALSHQPIIYGEPGWYEQLIPAHTVIIILLTFLAYKNWKGEPTHAQKIQLSHGASISHFMLKRPSRRIKLLILACFVIIVLLGAHIYEMQQAMQAQQDGITALRRAGYIYPFTYGPSAYAVFGSADEDKLGTSGEFTYANVIIDYVVTSVSVNNGIYPQQEKHMQFTYQSGPLCYNVYSNGTTVTSTVPQFYNIYSNAQCVILVETGNNPAGWPIGDVDFNSYGSVAGVVYPGNHLYFILVTSTPIPLLP